MTRLWNVLAILAIGAVIGVVYFILEGTATFYAIYWQLKNQHK